MCTLGPSEACELRFVPPVFGVFDKPRAGKLNNRASESCHAPRAAIRHETAYVLVAKTGLVMRLCLTSCSVRR